MNPLQCQQPTWLCCPLTVPELREETVPIIGYLPMPIAWGIVWIVYHGQRAFEQMVNIFIPANKSQEMPLKSI